MARPQPTPYEVAYYEGLVTRTAYMTCPVVEDDFDDIQQTLRVKVWKALEAYDPDKATQSIDRFVFSCVRNQVKDILKRKRRNEQYMDGASAPAREHFEGRYLSCDHDDVFREIEGERPLIPSTLDELERTIVSLLYASYTQREIALRLTIRLGEVEKAVASIRLKMDDWRPAAIAVVEPERIAA